MSYIPRNAKVRKADREFSQQQYAIGQAAKKPPKHQIGDVVDGFPVVGYTTNAGDEKCYLVLSTKGPMVELGRTDRKPFEVSRIRGEVFGFWVNERAITRTPKEG